MVTDIIAFWQRVSANGSDTEAAVYEAIAEFGEQMNLDFRERYPEKDPAVYWETDEWLTLIGTGLGRAKTCLPDRIVTAWMQGRIAQFIAEQDKKHGLAA